MKLLYDIAWLDGSWLTPGGLESFKLDFYLVPGNPFYTLLVFILIAISGTLLWQFKKAAGIKNAFNKSATKSSTSSVLRFITPIILGLSIGFLCFSLTSPHKVEVEEKYPKEGLDIILTLDISGSMRAPDLYPNRLRAAKRTAVDFIKGRKNDRIGLVIFSGEAFSQTPLTTDYKLLEENINNISFNDIQIGGTAIGNALGTSVNRIVQTRKNLKQKSKESSLIILLTDGDNTAGEIDPITAAQLAQSEEIKTYTIGIGKMGKIGTDANGQAIYALDESLLKKIAKMTKGKYFRATDNKSLESIFKEIDKLEKFEVDSYNIVNRSDYFYIYLLFGLFFLTIWFGLRGTFIYNALED